MERWHHRRRRHGLHKNGSPQTGAERRQYREQKQRLYKTGVGPGGWSGDITDGRSRGYTIRESGGIRLTFLCISCMFATFCILHHIFRLYNYVLIFVSLYMYILLYHYIRVVLWNVNRNIFVRYIYIYIYILSWPGKLNWLILVFYNCILGHFSLLKTENTCAGFSVLPVFYNMGVRRKLENNRKYVEPRPAPA